MVQRNIINFKQFTPKNTRNTGGFKINICKTEKGSATAGYSPDCRASYFIFSESYVLPAVPLSGDQLT
jgi:hypothetical protein